MAAPAGAPIGPFADLTNLCNDLQLDPPPPVIQNSEDTTVEIAGAYASCLMKMHVAQGKCIQEKLATPCRVAGTGS